MPLNLKDTKSKDYVIQLFHEYLLREHRSDLVQLSTTKSDSHVSVIVHFNCLCEFASIFSELLLSRPQETLCLLDEGLRVALNSTRSTSLEVSTTPSTRTNSDAGKRYTTHVRFTALPVIPEVHKNTVPWSVDVGKFIALRGTVSRVGPVQVLEARVVYNCGKCGFRFAITASFENYNKIKIPRRCPNRQLSCLSTNLKPVSDTVFYAKNYQEIRVHERYRCLSVGLMPRSICVCLEDDLLETVKPGDDVVINGIVTCRWHAPRDGAPCDVSLCIRANYVENLSEMVTGTSANRVSGERIAEFESFWSTQATNFARSLEARNVLIRSICPDVYGMYWIKLSLALMLAGSPEWTSPSSEEESISGALRPRIRGSPHILLVGDPGTAKSVLLRAATNLSHRAVLTAATGTTAAGLTATAVRDANGWSLDAGALVLADGGLCAIDEFTALHGTHRSAVHEAMEQQTISLAKAGLMTRLNCRCSVLAAANPRPEGATAAIGDGNEFGLPTPLLSRFDLIWRLADPVDSTEWDRKIAKFVLKLSDGETRGKHVRRPSQWPVDRLREYFLWVRQQFVPQLSRPAAELLQRYYVWRRKRIGDNNEANSNALGRCTLRLLESLVRLTKAHARLMARSEAGIEDAVIIIGLIDASLQSTGGTDGPSRHSGTSIGLLPNFISPETIVASEIPLDPGQDYTAMAKSICGTLNNLGPTTIPIHIKTPTPPDSPVKQSIWTEIAPIALSLYKEEEEKENKNDLETDTFCSRLESSLAPLSSAPLFTSTQLGPARWTKVETTMMSNPSSKPFTSDPPSLENKSVFSFKSRPDPTTQLDRDISSFEPELTMSKKRQVSSDSWCQNVRDKLIRFSASDTAPPPLPSLPNQNSDLSDTHKEAESSVYRIQQTGGAFIPNDFNSLSAPFHPSLDVDLTDEDFDIDL